MKITRQLGCVSQDMEPPRSLSILRKSSNIRKPIRWFKFTTAVVRHADIRDQNPSLGMICPGDPHQRNANAPKFEDRSQEETEWQEEGAREAAWRLAKSILKLMEKDTTAFPMTFGEIGAYLRNQLLNLRKENLLSTPERRCTWSAKRTWILLNWNLWRRREPNDGHNSQWLSVDAWRGRSLSPRVGYILDNESRRGIRQQFYR